MIKKIRNFYYFIAGALAILFAVTHAWNGESVVLRSLDIEEIPVGFQTIFTYVWHIITVENLVFGIAFIIMSFHPEPLKIQFTAWLIVAILIVRLFVILGITAILDISGISGTLMDSVAIIIYVILILLGTKIKSRAEESLT